MLRKSVVVLGCGGHGRVLHDILTTISDVNIVGFVDDDVKKVGKIINNTRVLGTSLKLSSLRADGIDNLVVGIGDNYLRANLFKKWREKGFNIYSVIHPNTNISRDVALGEGFVAMPGSIVNTGTSIGDNVCINTAATIDHDNSIGDHVNIYPGANLTGGVSVGRYTSIGSNAVINPNIVVGSFSEIGSGTVVSRDVQDNVTVREFRECIVKKRNVSGYYHYD